MTRIPGDLTEAEIDRRYRLALSDIRRGGTGEVARPRSKRTLRAGAVLAAISTGDTTVGALAQRLGYELAQVWGHVCFLRKCQKVEVKRWTLSPRGRKLAVYGVKA